MARTLGFAGAGLDRANSGGVRRMTTHVRTHDFPETVSRWRELGRDAGFGVVHELYVAPTDLFRLFPSGPEPDKVEQI